MKVWLVSSGSYSDYQIERAFTRQEDAETYSTGDFDRRVEEFDLTESLGDRIEVLEVTEMVVGARYGEPSEGIRTYWHGPDDEQIAGLPVCSAGELYKSNFRPGVFVWVSGTDQERVRKVFSEKRAQAVAML